MLVYIRMARGYGSKRYYKKGGSKRFKKTRYSNSSKSNAYKLDKKFNKKIKKIENDLIELKYNDVTFNGNEVNDTGVYISLIDDIVQGTDNSARRIGNEIHVTSTHIRGYVRSDPSALTSIRIRCILFWDKQNNGEDPALIAGPSDPRDALLDNTLNLGDPTNMMFMYETKDRFKVLWDKVYTFNPQVVLTWDSTTPATNTVTEFCTIEFPVNKFKKLGRNVKFNQAADAMVTGETNINTNNLYMAVFSNESDETITPEVFFLMRTYFKDA